VIEALVGTEHHSVTRQTFFHSSLVIFLFGDLEKLKAMKTFELAIRTDGLVFRKSFVKNRGFAILTIRNLKIALL
jgi:hypothetical protein